MGTEIRYKTMSGWFLDQAESSGEEMVVSLGPADIDNSRILELVVEEAEYAFPSRVLQRVERFVNHDVVRLVQQHPSED